MSYYEGVRVYFQIVNSSCFMMIGLYQILQSLEVISNTEASFEELDVSPSLSWVRDGVVVRKHRAP